MLFLKCSHHAQSSSLSLCSDRAFHSRRLSVHLQQNWPVMELALFSKWPHSPNTLQPDRTPATRGWGGLLLLYKIKCDIFFKILFEMRVNCLKYPHHSWRSFDSLIQKCWKMIKWKASNLDKRKNVWSLLSTQKGDWMTWHDVKLVSGIFHVDNVGRN